MWYLGIMCFVRYLLLWVSIFPIFMSFDVVGCSYIYLYPCFRSIWCVDIILFILLSVLLLGAWMLLTLVGWLYFPRDCVWSGECWCFRRFCGQGLCILWRELQSWIRRRRIFFRLASVCWLVLCLRLWWRSLQREDIQWCVLGTICYGVLDIF